MTKITIRVITLLALALLPQNIRCENNNVERSLPTSTVGMKFLLKMERQLMLAVENYAIEMENKLKVIRSAVTEMRTENLKSKINPEEYLSNPINSYALIRRLHQDWTKWEKFVRSSIGAVEMKKIKEVLVDKPTSTDLAEAAEGIYRLNIVYGIKPADMATGLINGKQYDAHLSSIDCFSIGKLLFQSDKNDVSEGWLNTAVQLYQFTEINTMFEYDLANIFQLYAKVLLKQGRLPDALGLIDSALIISPHRTKLLKTKSEIELKIKTPTKTVAKSKRKEQDEEDEDEKYMKQVKHLCLQHTYQSKLHCLYNKTTSAFLQLAPLKMEILHLDPYVVLFHDVISDGEITALKDMAEHRLSRAETFNAVRNTSTVQKGRTGKKYWFQNPTNVITRLEQRISDMSGFDLWDSEVIEILNYGIGGHFSMHYDFFYYTEFSQYQLMAGDRLATVMVYLSEVEQGGAIIFPKIQLSVFPKKGSALMWYNLNIKGEPDERTLHAACPVIVGSKWIFNKWIRQNSQMFIRRCYA